MKTRKHIILFWIGFLFCSSIAAQQTPSTDENIPYICTFGKDAEKTWGDDDFVQIFFFVIPDTYKKPVYVRIFDADVGGNIDEVHGSFNTKCRFSVYGGARAHSHPDAKGQEPVGNYKSGVLLGTKTFGAEKAYDNQWYTLSPFNPSEGELQPEFGGRVFKIVVEGIEGDDGNLYRLFLSSSSDDNIPIEGGNTFAYEYTFRLSDTKGAVSHLYPFVGPNVTAVKIRVFDFDNDGLIRTVSVAKRGEISRPNSNGAWSESIHKISGEEVNTSLDIQFIKQKESRNNNVVVVISNQYGELMPFYTSPIGGVPKFTYKIAYKTEED